MSRAGIVRLFCCALSGLLLVTMGCDFNRSRHPTTGEARAGANLLPGPDFELLSLDGHPVRLSSYRGRVLLLNFWATWCTSCRGEMPELQTLADAMDPEQVAIVGISVDEKTEGVTSFLEELGVTYTVLLDPDSKSAALFGGIEGYPMTFVLDQEGLIYSSYLGAQDQSVFLEDLNYLLQAEASEGASLPDGTF